MSKYHYCAWTSEEDRKLIHVMNEGIDNREKVRPLFHKAAALVGRTAKACENRWYELKARAAV